MANYLLFSFFIIIIDFHFMLYYLYIDNCMDCSTDPNHAFCITTKIEIAKHEIRRQTIFGVLVESVGAEK